MRIIHTLNIKLQSCQESLDEIPTSLSSIDRNKCIRYTTGQLIEAFNIVLFLNIYYLVKNGLQEAHVYAIHKL